MNKRFITIAGVLVLLAYLAGRYSSPARVTESKQTEVSRDLVIGELERQLKTKSSQSNSVTVTSTVQSPDGTIRTRTKTSTSTSDVSVESVIKAHEEKLTEKTKKIETKVIERSRGVILSLTASTKLNELGGISPGVEANVPMMLGFYLGAGLSTNSRVQVSVGHEF